MKAGVLAAARRRVRGADVPRLVHFSVAEWRRRPDAILRRIAASVAGEVAVRSSARDEDRPGASRAGHYPTVLGVASERAALASAIERVAAPLAGDLQNRVLVQAMAQDVVASGVVATHDARTGAPYYVVEYDRSARTDTVTGGLVVPTTAAVFRGAPLRAVRDVGVRCVLRVTREVERWRPHAPLELEFALTGDGRVALLQIRPLAIAPDVELVPTPRVARRLAAVARAIADVDHRGAPVLAGRRTILAQMPDWNPAELIGAHPSPLAASLFATLVTDDVWQRARARMGYRPVPGVPLMRIVAGRPYVDVRASFNSFLPAGLPDRIAEALVDGWIARLRHRPELHDKVEFEVAKTAVDFTFAARGAAVADGLSSHERALWVDALRRLTNRALARGPASSLARASGKSRAIGSRAAVPRCAAADPLGCAFDLVAVCRDVGTMPFAIVARHAFIAETLLRSGVACGAWTAARLTAFRRSLTTVASELSGDLRRVARGVISREEFVRRYGHVRPSSFDVTSARYDQRSELFDHVEHGAASNDEARAPFALTAAERRAFRALARDAGLTRAPDDLLRYAATAVVARERVKFELARPLSAALECIAAWGAGVGLDRADVACVTLDDLRAAGYADRSSRGRAAAAPPSAAAWGALVEARRRARALDRGLRLAPVIRDVADLYAPPPLRARPTFVTARTVVAPSAVLHGAARAVSVAGRIVCVESADPGFDWIFAHRLAGLVTRFGGGNSHMAVRCVEADVPAAIGVGEDLFERLRRAAAIELRCAEGRVRPA